MSRSGSPTSAPSRTLDIPLDEAETVSIELEMLMADPSDYIELLKEGNSNAGIWTRLACEYWRKGNRSATNAICSAAVECTFIVVPCSESPLTVEQL